MGRRKPNENRERLGQDERRVRAQAAPTSAHSLSAAAQEQVIRPAESGFAVRVQAGGLAEAQSMRQHVSKIVDQSASQHPQENGDEQPKWLRLWQPEIHAYIIAESHSTDTNDFANSNCA